MRTSFWIFAFAFGIFTSLNPTLAFSLQSPGYLQIRGIAGDSQESNHKEWFELISFDQGPFRWTLKDQAGLFLPQESGSMGPGKLTVTRSARKSSPELYQAVFQGTYLGTVQIELPISPGTESKYIKWTLSDVVVSSVHVERSQEKRGVPIEQVTLSFQNASWERNLPAVTYHRRPTHTFYSK